MNRIKELRERAGLTQEGLGKLLSVQKAAVSKYENDIVPLTDDTLIDLSKIFNCSIDYILGNTNSKISESDQKKNKATIRDFLKDKGLDDNKINAIQNLIDSLTDKEDI